MNNLHNNAIEKLEEIQPGTVTTPSVPGKLDNKHKGSTRLQWWILTAPKGYRWQAGALWEKETYWKQSLGISPNNAVKT